MKHVSASVNETRGALLTSGGSVPFDIDERLADFLHDGTIVSQIVIAASLTKIQESRLESTTFQCFNY